MTHRTPPRLSAHALKTWDDCARKFALTYVQQAFWPDRVRGVASDDEDEQWGDPEAQRALAEKVALGDSFHQLVQIASLGLDVRELAQADPRLDALWQKFQASEHAVPPAGAKVWTEQQLNFFVDGVPVNVRYDRLVKHEDTWTILDWKTGRVDARRLERSWQTRLYCFALVEAGAALGEGPVLPEAVTLVYWEVSTGTALTFGYDADSWRKDREALAERVAAAQQPFDPHLADDPSYPRRHHHCGRCLYDTLCNLPADDPGAATRELRVPKFS